MTEPELEKLERQLADAILLERAAKVLERTSRRCVADPYSSGHWLSVKETLRAVAQAKRAGVEAAGYARTRQEEHRASG